MAIRITPRSYRKITLAALLSLAFIVVTGAAVRLTGSGLGCTDWPTCEEGKVVAPLEFHAMVEFVNRVITGFVSVAVILAVLGSLARAPRRRDLTWLSLGLVAGVIGQIVLGGIVVLTHVHPVAVQGHFVLSMVILLDALVLHQRAGEPDGVPLRPTVSLIVRRLAYGLAALASLVVVTGTLVTGTGPHGGDDIAERFDFRITDVARLHTVTVWITLAGVLLLVWVARRQGDWATIEDRVGAVLWVGVAQGMIGYLQYATGVPVGLVALHVAGSIAFWAVIWRLVFVTRAPVTDLVPSADAETASVRPATV